MDPLKAEKLALARKKAKRSRESGVSPTPSGASSVINDQVGSAPNSFHSEQNGRISAISTNSIAGEIVHDSLTPKYDSVEHQYGAAHQIQPAYTMAQNGDQITAQPSMTISPANSTYVQNMLYERDAAIQSLTQQLEHMLHSAYAELSSRAPENDVSSNEQIVQLQSALSGLVSEKTWLQAQLRESQQQYEVLRAEFSSHVESQRSEQLTTEVSARELEKLKAELEEKERLLQKRIDELEAERSETLALKSQFLTIQHERNEAQARLKNIFREKDFLMDELKKLRKDVQMKDLHIKQFAMHSSSNCSDPGISADQLIQAYDEREQLKETVEELKQEVLKLRKEAVDSDETFKALIRNMNGNIMTLNKSLDEADSAHKAAESRIVELENELELERRRAAECQTASNKNASDLSNGYTDAEVMSKVDEAVRRVTLHWEQNLEQVQKENEKSLQERESLLSERDAVILELQSKLNLADEHMKTFGDASTELLQLSEQLQAEKATVSRAVAQNRELKEQLLATEDRLLAVTEEKSSSELARQSAEHQVKVLRQQVDEITSSTSSSGASADGTVTQQPESIIKADEHFAAAPNELESQELLMLQRELHEARQQLDEVRAELRRSHTQNEQMNQIMRQNAEDENQNSILVELEQAVGRVNVLANENEALHEEVENLRRANAQINEAPPIVQHRSDDDATAIEVEAATIRIHQLRQENEALREQNSHFAAQLNDVEEKLAILEAATENSSTAQAPAVNATNNTTKDAVVTKNSYPVGSTEWAQIELEKRFSDAMRRVADLREQCDHVEHINVQLQLENETIADHVILYQHQRRLIRERLRLKDEQMAAVERERERVVSRCNELETALRKVLGKLTPSENCEEHRHRSYSHSTVDELSGDEECVVEAESKKQISRRVNNEDAVVEAGNRVEASLSEEGAVVDWNNREAAMRKLFDIIDDIKKPNLPFTGTKLQCNHCIGELRHL